MTSESVHTLVIGAGQAGIAASEHLSARNIPHLVLERDRIAERWRTQRWDNLVANGPAWHDRFPGLEFSNTGPDGFPGKDEIAAYFEAYATQINAPLSCGVEVTSVSRANGSDLFDVATSGGNITARNIIAATGPFQRPLIPPLVPEKAGPAQMHSSAYRNAHALAPGGVLVVGAGSSGAQIAQELMEAGRDVYLSVGPHDRPPRSYRGRDFVWWLGVLGKWDAASPGPGTEHVTIAVSGAHGGRTIDFRDFAERGMTLLGRTEGWQDGSLTFADDLDRNIRAGDANLIALLEEADAYIAAHGLDLPPEPGAHVIGPDPACVTDPVRRLDLRAAGISTIIWATGFALDFSWLKVDAFDAQGKPRHQRGVSAEPGVYFLGLPWLSRRGSSFIWGVWHDASHVADQIAIRDNYLDYHPSGAT